MLYIARYKIRSLILISKRNIIKDDIIHIRKISYPFWGQKL